MDRKILWHKRQLTQRGGHIDVCYICIYDYIQISRTAWNLYNRFICHYWSILQGMSKERTSLINYDSPSLIAKTPDRSSSPSPPIIFILCDSCYWCATYLDKTRIPGENRCPQCDANYNELTSFLLCRMNHLLLIIMINVG